ncbi:MAG: polysaccharide deacetylase family protein, partial [Magnetococcales bacterium]|nr:polysaccharide deacetylase family protein [Magnetococcales bacterium]
AMEQASAEIYRQFFGDPADLGVHLGVAEIIKLQQSGWEIANHTTAHRLLSSLSPPAVKAAIEENAVFWRDNGVQLINFLGFPVGRVCDVGPAVGRWLDDNPKIHGIFANNGININLHRKEWLRFSLGLQTNPENMHKIIKNQTIRSRAAYEKIG